MGQWLDSITGWLTLNPQWLAVAVFIVACVECLAIAGLIVPGTVLLFAIAALAGSGALSLSETLLLGFLGGLLGDGVSYYLGRHFHQRIRNSGGTSKTTFSSRPGCSVTILPPSSRRRAMTF